MENQSAYGKERQTAAEIALEAAKIVADFYETGAKVEWKAEDDPVTEADKAANTLILDRLAAAFPSDAILSEESRDDLSRLEAERVWIVDPLDGTKDFVNRTGEFAVMIGLVDRGVPVVGAVCQPLNMWLWHGEKGQGAALRTEDGVRQLTTTETAASEEMKLVVTRSHRYPLLDELCQVLGIKKEHPLGSVGLKMGALSCAEADLYIHLSLGTKEWDTCAPGLILSEAGGVITDAFGRPLKYNQKDVMRRSGVVASNGKIHEAIISKMAEVAEKADLG